MKNIYYTFVFAFLSFCCFEGVVYAQCQEFAASVANFANANVGEVLCDGAEGCEAGGFELTGFQVWTNEAYLLGKLYPGAEYVFDICEGYNSNNWRAELTALEYINGDTPSVVAGTVMGTVKDCQLVFTVPTTYTDPVDVMVIISEEGNCGGEVREINNGFPFFGCGANGGQPACDVVEVSCDDPNITPGTIAINSNTICFNDTLFFSSDAPFAPEAGQVSGFSWLITSEDISGVSNPLSGGVVVGGYPVDNANEDTYLFVNDGGFEAGTYYFTPIVFGNGVGDANGAIFNITLDPNCTFVGQSVLVEMLPEGDPSCGDCEPPTVEIFSTECDEEGLFELEVDVTFGSATSYTVIDSLRGYSTVLTSEGTAVLGAYEGGEIPLWIIGEGNPDCNLSFLLADFCPVLCDVVSDGGFEEGSGSWVEFEEPDQPDFTIIDGSIPMTGSLSAYLGGYENQQITNISQLITIPNTQNATLSFYGYFFCADVNDNFKVLIDETTVLDVTGSDEELCSTGYFTRFELDLRAFADGEAHTLQFSLFGTDAGYTAFFLDDVQLNACSCIANSGTLKVPEETTLCADTAFDFQAETNNDGYIGALSDYLFLLVDGAGNIVANSMNGTFDFEDIASGDYEVHGLSLLVGDAEKIQELTHITQIENRIAFGTLCADFTDVPYTLTYDANCVGIEELVFENDFQITSIAPASATSLKLAFQAQKQQDLQWMFYDVNGRLLQSQTVSTSMGENESEMEIPAMSNGVYFTVLTDGRSLVSRQFLLMR